MGVLDDVRNMECGNDLSFGCEDEFCPDVLKPRIVAALVAAERVITDSECEGVEPVITIWANDSDWTSRYAFCGAPIGVHDAPHNDGCPWQALVAALAGEKATV